MPYFSAIHILAITLALAAAAGLAKQVGAGGGLVTFPERHAEGVRYATVERTFDQMKSAK